MKFGKNANIKRIWKWVELTEEEIEKALTELLEHNKTQLKRLKNIATDSDEFKILADKQLIASYTYLSGILDAKIEKMKSENKPYTPQNPIYKKAEQYAEKKLQEKDETLEKPSIIDEAMQKAEAS